MTYEHRELAFWDGYDNVQSGLETLNVIRAGCNDSRPFYFIRFSDVDSHIVSGRINRLQKKVRYDQYYTNRGLTPPPYEASDESLRKEMLGVRGLYQQDNVVLTSHNNKLCPVDSNRAYNYYCLSTGVYHYEHFIPFLKASFKNTLFLCDNHINGNELIEKMFDVKTFLECPPSAYFSIDELYNRVKNLIGTHDTIVGAVGFSTKIIAKRLYEDGFNTNFIDIGSAVDPLAGRASRGMTKKMVKCGLGRPWKEIYHAYADAFNCDRNKLIECNISIKKYRQLVLTESGAIKNARNFGFKRTV